MGVVVRMGKGLFYLFLTIVAILGLTVSVIQFVIPIVNYNGLKVIYNTIQNKTLEQNQTLAYEVGYTEGYYQCVGEVQQAQAEGLI